MKNKNSWFLQLFLLLFTFTLASSALPCGIITAHGIWGEVSSSVITEKEEAEALNIHQHSLHKSSRKGTNIFQIWYKVWILVIAMIFVLYVLRLPKTDTVITLKIRMNN